jgi:Holliday junction DNA helicase RuvA
MIAHLTGRVAAREPNRVVLDVHGVGYLVLVPLSTFYQLPDVGSDAALHIVTHVREDAIQLFGFHTREEQTLFELLQAVSGIGPRLATNILSGISVGELMAALSQGDLARLRAVPGVGKKLAERLVVELKEKVGTLGLPVPAAPSPPAPADRVVEDVVSALVNLGCNRKEAQQAAEVARQALGPKAEFEQLVKAALRGVGEQRA